MTNKLATLILMAVISLILVACGSDSADVPSLGATPTAVVEQEPLDEEAKVMAFVQCMRDQGIEYKDPQVDADGNVQRPELVEGVTMTRKELAEPYQTCVHHLEGLSFGRQRTDVSAQVDQFVKITTCLREKGYDVDDPTVEAFKQWATDFRATFDWDDQDAMKAYEECSSAD